MNKYCLGLLSVLLLAETGAMAKEETGVVRREPAAISYTSFSDKPQAPVDVRYQLQNIPAAGQPLDIEMQFRSSGSAQVSDTKYRSEPVLTINNPGELEVITGEDGDTFISQSVTVIPVGNGLYHLTVFATVLVDSRSLVRVVSLPIQVGPKSNDPVFTDKEDGITDMSGVPIRPLPATTSMKER
jgi:hypothetical protein